ncbi:MAG: hypothetical protein EXS08_04675 [Planctomycetes bacterium]|nr:hypothetical protein [Planctomycetota bacterium]
MRVSGLRPADEPILRRQLGPDCLHPVFESESGSRIGLYAAALTKEAAPKLLGGGPASSERGTAVIAPDSSRVLFLDWNSTSRRLLSATLEGGPAIELSPPLAASESIDSLCLAGKRVLHLSDHERGGLVELFGVPFDGSTPARKLSGNLVQRRRGARLRQCGRPARGQPRRPGAERPAGAVRRAARRPR